MPDDPLQFDPDPLSSTSNPAPLLAPAKPSSSRSSSATWARPDLFAEPFSAASAWAQAAAAAMDDGATAHPQASTNAEDEREEHPVAPVSEPSPAPTAGSPPSANGDTSSTSFSPSNDTAAAPTPSAPITMRSASSLSRERTSSTTGLREGRSAVPHDLLLLNGGGSSPTGSSSYGVSVTPRGGGGAAPPSFARFENDNILTLTASGGGATPSAHRPSPLVVGGRPGSSDVERLRRSVFAAASDGDLDSLQALMSGDAGDADYPTGFEQSNWVNGEGETPLHRACYKGHLHVAIFLENSGANVEVSDNDGWTPLMNAASRGYLDIVRWLVEDAGAMIDRRSKHGYTALMNAASRGHLPIITFLTTKHRADPLLRNEWGETASDLAASVFEVQICSVLAAYESSLWSGSDPDGVARPPYNPLSLHSTIPVVLHENQRLARPTLKKLSSLGTLAARQGPRWSSKALSRNDNRTAFTMPSLPGVHDAVSHLPVYRSEVGLPVVGNENVLVLPGPREVRSGGRPGVDRSAPQSVAEGKRPVTGPRRSSASSALTAVLTASSSAPPDATPTTPSNTSFSANGAEPAWFWLSDWSVDLTDPHSSPLDGWSYASSFDAPDDEWSSEPPEDLQRLLEGGGAIGFGGKKYVRRRRWVRVMRRRLDIPDWGFGGVQSGGASEPIELVSSRPRTPPGADYLVRAQFLAGTNSVVVPASDRASIRSGKTLTRGPPDHGGLNKLELRKAAARLERAADELRRGTLTDENADRRRRAEDQLETYLHQTALIRAEVGPEDENEEDSDDEFIYSGRDADPDDDARSTWTANLPARPASVRSGRSTASSDYFARPVGSPTSHFSHDLTPDLSRAPEFRVPTHETQIHQEVPAPRAARVLPVWEPDEEALECRRCARKFSFFNRKHHCRRCGLVCCYNCTTHNDRLDPAQVVRVPGGGLEEYTVTYRTCDQCHAALSLPQGVGTASFLSPGAFFPAPASVGGSTSPSDAGASDVSELSECPVCGTILSTVGGKAEQEEHVKDCLETGGGAIASNGRYLVFKLPPGPLVSEECKICFVEFDVGDKLARLPCLCCFHHTCIRAWISRGKSCPFHASRD